MILQPIGSKAAAILLGRFRWNIPLSGVCDGLNRLFILPEPAFVDLPYSVVRVYHGGRKLNDYEYQVLESVPGSGNYDRVKLTSWAPSSRTQLVADYTAI